MGTLISAAGTMDTAAVGGVDFVLLSVSDRRQPPPLVGCSSWRLIRSICFLLNGKIIFGLIFFSPYFLYNFIVYVMSEVGNFFLYLSGENS